MQTQQAQEIPLPPHKPRNDAQKFPLADTTNYNYVHQHTKGYGPMQDCSIIEQYDDGYCKVIAGYNRNVLAWSGCLTRDSSMTVRERERLEAERVTK